GDPKIHEVALRSFRTLLAKPGTDGAGSRVEAARLIGEVNDPEFSGYLSKLIREDPSTIVVQEALAAAAKTKEPGLLRDVIARRCCPTTKGCAHQALVEYGEVAVETLRKVLLDSHASRDVRLNVPSVLSKIASPNAMDALLDGLNQEDGS